jgi:hypothetical protein
MGGDPLSAHAHDQIRWASMFDSISVEHPSTRTISGTGF